MNLTKPATVKAIKAQYAIDTEQESNEISEDPEAGGVAAAGGARRSASKVAEAARRPQRIQR